MTSCVEENLMVFNDFLFQSIDETITALLSREVADALFDRMQRKHSVSKSEVPYKLETLCSTIEQIFGHAGSETIYRAIAKKFYAKLGLVFSSNHSQTLIEYVEEAKIKLEKGEGQL